MASANYEKYKTVTEAKAKMMHNATDTRLEHEHENQEIDKTRTYLNQSEKYEDMCELYDNRIAELDATTNKNKRKDRITLIGLEIPVPKDLPREKYKDWFADVHSLIADHYGEKNTLPMAIHYDEEHEYFDPEKKEMVMSRVHGHTPVIPEKDGGLNAKWATGRYNMTSMNNEIHTMTAEKYDVEFMDGTKRKSDKSVTALKNTSRKAELEAREVEILRREQSVDIYSADTQDLEQRLARRQTEFEEYKQQEETKLQERENSLNDRDAAFFEKIEAVNAEFEVRDKALDERAEGLNGRDHLLKAQESNLSTTREEIRISKENTLKNEIRAKKGYSEIDTMLVETRNILASAKTFESFIQEAPSSLVEFAKTYTRKVAKTEVVMGKRRPVKGSDGKNIPEEHNAFDDWQAHLAGQIKRDKDKQAIDDQVEYMQNLQHESLDRQFGE